MRRDFFKRFQMCLGLAWMLAGPGADAAEDWRWEVAEEEGKHLWLRSFIGETAMFSWRIGAGGAVAELRDEQGGGTRLLSPSFQGEATDRIIQWTCWSESVRNEVADLPAFEHRFNVTQGGTFSNRIAPTMRVLRDDGNHQLDVYAVPQDQWKTEQQQAMRGKLSCLTRYRMMADGALSIRRLILVDAVRWAGGETGFKELYLEAWTPFDRSGTFDGLALALDEAGTPAWWYAADRNVPRYPNLAVGKTAGYAVVYSIGEAAANTAVGVIFGKKEVAGNAGGSHVLNLMTWNNGIGILPALQLKDIEAGSVLEQTLVILPRRRLDAEMAGKLADWAAKVPGPRVHAPGADFPEELREIVAELRANLDRPGKRTEELGR